MSHGYQNLKVWHKAYKLTLMVYQATKSFPKDEKYELIPQMRRASTSMIANIAEGYGRKNLTGYINFLQIAIGSCNELGVFLMLSKDLKYLEKKNYEDINSVHTEVTKMLLALKRSLENKSNPNS